MCFQNCRLKVKLKWGASAFSYTSKSSSQSLKMGVIASLPAAKQALKSVKHYYSLRPRSCLEFYECMRDDVIMVWQFQYVWWSTGCCWLFAIVSAESTEYCLMSLIYYVVFTLPCLSFCKVFTLM